MRPSSYFHTPAAFRCQESIPECLFPETTEIGRVRSGGLRTAVRLCNVEWGRHKNVSEKLLDSGTVLFTSQRRKPTKISTGHKAVVAFRSYKSRRSKRIDLKKSASLVVNLDRIPKRLPCLIVDSSPEGFRLMGTFKLKRGQVVEIIADEDPLNISKCQVIWIGKAGSKQEGQVGLQLLNPTVNLRGA